MSEVRRLEDAGAASRAEVARRLRPYLSPGEWEVYGRIFGVYIRLDDESPFRALMSTTVSDDEMDDDDYEVYSRLLTSLPDTWDVSPEEWRLRDV